MSKKPPKTYFRINLTPEQWDGLLEGKCPWLPPCCGNIGATRGILRDAKANGGVISHSFQVIRLIDNAITHDVIREAWLGTPLANPKCSWAHREGSPWPTIFQALREWDPGVPDRVHRLTQPRRT